MGATLPQRSLRMVSEALRISAVKPFFVKLPGAAGSSAISKQKPTTEDLFRRMPFALAVQGFSA
jgi:hypothetical protein